MVWEGQFEENGFSNPDRFWDTPVTQKWVGSGTLQCPDGFPYPFLIGMGSPGADWCWDSPGYPPLLGPMGGGCLVSALVMMTMEKAESSFMCASLLGSTSAGLCRCKR